MTNILERIRARRTALKPCAERHEAVNMETDKNGNFNVFIVDRKGNVLFDKYGLTKRGRKITGKN